MSRVAGSSVAGPPGRLALPSRLFPGQFPDADPTDERIFDRQGNTITLIKVYQ